MDYVPVLGDLVEFGQYDKENHFHLLVSGTIDENGGCEFDPPLAIESSAEYEVRYWSRQYQLGRADKVTTSECKGYPLRGFTIR